MKAQARYDSLGSSQRKRENCGCQGLGGVGNGGLLCGGHRALIWEDEKVVEMGGGGGCTAV